MSFKIENDLEFYCYLKSNLPKDYKIISEPSTNYYSEWFFNYKIFYKNELVDGIQGNFKKIKKGELIQKAQQILKGIKEKK